MAVTVVRARPCAVAIGHLLEGSGVGYIPVAVLVGDGFGLFFGLFVLSVHNSGQMEIAGGRDESGGAEHPGFVVV